MSATISLDGVGKDYHGTPALDEITLEVDAGVIGLLGPNGAGKSTLLRIIATVLAPSTGQVQVLGHDPASPEGRLAIRRRLGYVPQEPGYYLGLTAFDFVDYIAVLKEMADRPARHAEVARVLGLVDLDDLMHQKLKRLSGGMRRRVILAQALLGDPDLLVLDEPTVGLDPEQRLRFRELVSRLGEERTVVLSTHQTEDVAALCRRVVVMDRGEIRFDGTPATLADQARGRVWLSDHAGPGAQVSWRTGSGQHRLIGDAPPGASLADPAIEDAYLLLLGRAPADGQPGTGI